LKDVFGKVAGLKASQLRRLERLSQRSGSKTALCEPVLARALTECAADLGRHVGVLLDRKGGVTDVILGEPTRLYLPDIGRLRAGPGRLRGLRLVVARLPPRDAAKEWNVDLDFITDLERLKLDAVVSIEAKVGGEDEGLPGRVAVAMLVPNPGHGEARTRIERWRTIHDVDVAFDAAIEALEEELARHTEHVRDAAVIPGEREVAVLVGVYALKDGMTRAEATASMTELRELAATAGVRVVDEVMQLRDAIDGRTVVGSGKLEELCLMALHQGAEMLVFDRELSPSQLNAITDLTDLKIVDRTMLILDIFARRAKSREGRMQVELAQLRYSVPRLAKKQEGLSRLTGGIGGQGPGETKLEIDRRRAKEKITRLEREIDQFALDRQLRRQRRDDRGVPIIAIVGYTNAGKSTLLNRLTGAAVYVADELFATLDPTSRRLRFPQEREVVLTDTVGFIRDLPTPLKNAFRATLEELHEADLLLHIVDARDPRRRQQVESVESVLDELGVLDTPRLMVLNKSEGHPGIQNPAMDAESNRQGAVRISALDGSGLDRLVERMASALWDRDGSPDHDDGVWSAPPASPWQRDQALLHPGTLNRNIVE
jgi:GTP-binding protein HflX